MDKNITESLTFMKMFYLSMCTIIGTFLNYLNLETEIFALYALLLVIDYITGLLKALRLKQHIKSNIMKYGILSKLILLLIPLTLLITAKIVGVDIESLVKVSINILALSELYSIISNLYSYRTAKELPEYDVLSLLGRYIRNFIMGVLGANENYTKENNENDI